MMISSEKPLTLNTYLSWKWCEYIYLQTINQYSLLCLGACVGGIIPHVFIAVNKAYLLSYSPERVLESYSTFLHFIWHQRRARLAPLLLLKLHEVNFQFCCTPISAFSAG